MVLLVSFGRAVKAFNERDIEKEKKLVYTFDA
jgi:hypothetical protein